MVSEEKMKMNSTTRLLQLLGSPFTLATNLILDDTELMKLYRKSIRNRMLFFYFETINERYTDFFSMHYQEEKARYLKTGDAIARVSDALTSAHVKHAVFKTIRPYKSTTVDIDILILEDRSYIRSIEAMQEAGYKLVVNGPRSTTFWDKEAGIGIDLYEQIATSFIIYIDKQTLAPYLSTAKMENGKYVRILKCEADLLCIIAHSIIKEQMYTLSEYFTFIHYLKQLNLRNFLKLVEENNLSCATRTHATITALLHKVAHGTMPKKLQELLCSLGEDKFEISRLNRKNLVTPHKYHPITLAKSLLEITKGKTTRESIATQLFHFLDLKFSKDFASKLVNHILRETY